MCVCAYACPSIVEKLFVFVCVVIHTTYIIDKVNMCIISVRQSWFGDLALLRAPMFNRNNIVYKIGIQRTELCTGLQMIQNKPPPKRKSATNLIGFLASPVIVQHPASDSILAVVLLSRWECLSGNPPARSMVYQRWQHVHKSGGVCTK